MPVDTFQLKSVAIKCLQGCWGPRHEKINGVSHSKITHCAVLISVSVMIARKYKYWFWYCIRNNLAISKYSISNPNQRLSHNSGPYVREFFIHLCGMDSDSKCRKIEFLKKILEFLTKIWPDDVIVPTKKWPHPWVFD